MAPGRYVSHLRKLGIKSPKLTTDAGIQRFFVSLNWVVKDFPAREKYVKQGFPAWKKKWRETAITRYKKYKNGISSRKVENKKKIRKVPTDMMNYF